MCHLGSSLLPGVKYAHCDLVNELIPGFSDYDLLKPT